MGILKNNSTYEQHKPRGTDSSDRHGNIQLLHPISGASQDDYSESNGLPGLLAPQKLSQIQEHPLPEFAPGDYQDVR